MGLLAVASAKGSPGVTTAALLFAALWPRPSVLVECDPSGGDVALRMPAPDGEPLDSSPGLLNLVAAGRKSLYADLVDVHSEQIVGGLDVLTGMTTPEQAAGLGQWAQLGELFSRLPGKDAVVDLGRIGATTPQNAVLASASAVALVVDAIPSSVIHLRERLARVSESLGGTVGPPIYVIVVAPPKRTRAVAEVRAAIDRSGTPVTAVRHLADDPAGARFFLGQVSGSPSRTQLVRSAQPIVDELAARMVGTFLAPAPRAVPAGDGSLDDAQDDESAAPDAEAVS